MKKFKNILFLSSVLGLSITSGINAQSLIHADPANSFLNASDPTTIEYDNIVSTYHSTMARQSDGSVLLWGECMANDGVGHVTTPWLLNNVNYPALTGDILIFAGGSADVTQSQRVILTTDGLFAWGKEGILLNGDVTSGATFEKVSINGKADGLPTGVLPGDVKMLFGTFEMLGLVTTKGDVWALVNYDAAYNEYSSFSGPLTANAYGDGKNYSTGNSKIWHKVKTNATNDLSNIVAIRGMGGFNFTALKADGTLWTWGMQTYLGDGTGKASRKYATQMTLPVGITPKMIGMTGGVYATSNAATTYYVLATNGNVYSMGDNSNRQLGIYSYSESNVWKQVRGSSSSTFLTNVAWISPNEHDGGVRANVNALTYNGELWAWGSNTSDHIGGGSSLYLDPTPFPGGLTAADKILAVETGGHTSIVVKQCTNQYGYVGHRINGSMGDGTTTDAVEDTYNFTETAKLNLSGAVAVSQSKILNPESTILCESNPLTLSTNFPSGTFGVLTGNAIITGNDLIVTGAGDVKVTFKASGVLCSSTDTATFHQRDFGNLKSDLYPMASATIVASGQVKLGTALTVDCGTNVGDDADGVTIPGNTGNGQSTNPFMVTPAETYGIEINTNADPYHQVTWAIWYDVNGDGSFTDGDDIFESGITTSASTSVNITIPNSVSASGATKGAFRVAVTAQNITFTKEMNGTLDITNGEIEDYYVAYPLPLPVKLSSFNANKEGNSILLHWITASEQNNNGFEIERSAGDDNWSRIDFVKSKSLDGNSSTNVNYSYTDISPLNGVNYYRLKQIDKGGKYEYSEVRDINFTGISHIRIAPNPVRNELQKFGLSEKSTISISNASGIVLINVTVNASANHTINVSSLSKGIYFVKVKSAKGIIGKYKILKK